MSDPDSNSNSNSSCPLGYDSSNMMPPPNQMKHPDQKYDLSIDRISSSIPRGKSDSVWVYPSPQMFYNAIKRKGGEVSELEIPTIVAIHNTVNEVTWRHVLAWEQLHKDVCPNPSLLKFRGRPTEYSPKARFNMAIG
eukprot:TRINITY_DN3595_c0_g1_i1.p1 TRINITY_DN3595_c0_g1~~TRINITY_DN3595_c0_g1_i1.p1  ORF type:complete len:137 (-),score=51.63 TRINITY_DN3595_c0_g1_i1:89-499(-)